MTYLTVREDAPPSTALVELLAAIVAEHRRAKT